MSRKRRHSLDPRSPEVRASIRRCMGIDDSLIPSRQEVAVQLLESLGPCRQTDFSRPEQLSPADRRRPKTIQTLLDL
jgi:hypothetical protein